MPNQAIKTAKKYSEEILSELTKSLNTKLSEQDLCIVVVGSFARKEASQNSDLDYFILLNNRAAVTQKISQSITKIIKESEIKNHYGDTDTFGQCVEISELTTDLGGINDSNQKLTRRMLLLLEGYCLYGDAAFNRFRKQLLEEYIKETVSDHKSSRFLLNDIIRFYRTMATDFEHKTSEKGKDVNVRNIKLTFSRKLLYFSGIITIAETVQETRPDKIARTLQLLSKPPLERLEYVFNNRADKVLELYSHFLEKISDEKIRKLIEKHPIPKDGEFRRLKNKSKHFSWALSAMLKDLYDDSHPIHHALTF